MELWNSVLLKGVFCSTICNIIFIASNKIIIMYSLSGNNINFFKGSIQTILFFLILIIKNCLVKEETSRENQEDMVEQEEMLGDNEKFFSIKVKKLCGFFYLVFALDLYFYHSTLDQRKFHSRIL